jgi:hypothetical protein
MLDREYVYIVTADTGLKSFVMPSGFESNVTVHLWGAGGGRGYSGTNGGGGAYVSSTITLSPGDSVEVSVGNKGTNGSRERGGEGGTSGKSDTFSTLKGKTADNSQPWPGDDNNIGAGGGGGGATAIIVNGNVVVAAAGGGGGAGGSGYQVGTVGDPGGVQLSPSGGSRFDNGGHWNNNYATGGGGGGGYPTAGQNGYNVGDDVSGLPTGRGPAGGQGGYNYGGNTTVNGSGAVAGGRDTEYYPVTLKLTEETELVRWARFVATSPPQSAFAWNPGAVAQEVLELLPGQLPPNAGSPVNFFSNQLTIYPIGQIPPGVVVTYSDIFRTQGFAYWQQISSGRSESRPVASIANAGYPGYAVLVLQRAFNVSVKDNSNTWKNVNAAWVKTPDEYVTVSKEVLGPTQTRIFDTVGSTSFTVPDNVFAITVKYTSISGIVLSDISVTPGQVIPVVVGDYGQASSFGATTIPAYSKQIFSYSGNIDHVKNNVVQVATASGASFSGSGYNAALTAGAAAVGIIYQDGSPGEGWHGDLFATVSITPARISTILGKVRVVRSSGSGRQITNQTFGQQPSAGNSYIMHDAR